MNWIERFERALNRTVAIGLSFLAGMIGVRAFELNDVNGIGAFVVLVLVICAIILWGQPRPDRRSGW